MILPDRSSVLLASAGTGKTFQLSNRFLRLAQRGVPVEHILASTFTRKAAGEILGAILGRLAAACAEEGAFLELTEHLELEGRWDQGHATALLRDLLRAMPRMQVSTLDSWFQQQVQAASWDLDLPLGWRLAEEVELQELHRDAIEATLAAWPEEEVEELVAAMHAGKPGRSVTRRALDSGQAAARWWAASERREAAWELLAGHTMPSAQEWQAAIAQLDELVIPRTKAAKPVVAWVKAKASAVAALQEGQADAAFAGGFLKKALAGEAKYSHHEIPMEQVGPAVHCYTRQCLAELHRENVAMREFARAYAQNRKRLQRESRILGFDDFPERLAACTTEERQRIARRLGGVARHLLLDEFQDTNVQQWLALEPPIAEAVGKEQEDGSGSVLLVGDTKQSIYGFREGEPRLLSGFASWYGLESTPMATNWRSRQEILDCVNHVFLGLREVHGKSESPVLRRVLQTWADYPEHVAGKAGVGTVRLLEAQPGDGTKKEALWDAVLARIVDLHRRHPESTLGVLVRGNKVIPHLLARLAAEGVRASMSGGNHLTDARAVDVCLSLLHLADHPSDTGAWFHVATSPLAQAFDLDYGDGSERHRQAASLSRLVRRRLLEDGYGDFLDGLLQALRADDLFDPWNRARFAQLVELGRAWDAEADLRPSRFVTMVRARKVPDAEVTKVQVMTVHQSKGLAFDMVLVPMDDYVQRADGFFAVRQDPREAVHAVSRVPNTRQLLCARQRNSGEFLAAHAEARARSLDDDLCVLYVAMTRAKRHMELIVPAMAANPNVDDDWIRMAWLVRDTILRTPSPAAANRTATPLPQGASLEVLWQTQDLPTEEAPTLAQQEAVDPEAEAVAKPLLKPGDGRRSLPRWTPSGAAKENGMTDPARLFAAADDTARRRGTAIHRLFEEVAWLDDFALTEEEGMVLLQQLQPRPSADECARWWRDFQVGLQKRTVRDALTRPMEADAVFHLRRELPFAIPTTDPHGQSAILQGIFDRVVLREQEGRVVGAEVVDFKTGTAPADGTISDAYRAQLEAYRRALSVQHGIAEEAITCRLLFVDEGISVALEG